MGRKPIFWIIPVAIAALIVTGVFFGKQYFDDRYAGTDYYTMVPPDYDMTPGTLRDMNGEETEPGKDFKLTAYDAKGEEKVVEFSVTGTDASKYPQRGAFLVVNASKQLVLKWSVIAENKIPEGALAKIKG